MTPEQKHARAKQLFQERTAIQRAIRDMNRVVKEIEAELKQLDEPEELSAARSPGAI